MTISETTPTSIRREFLGWDRPALPEAARRLALRYRQGSMLDLGQVIVVVPGQRAGRRLQELLAFQAEDEKLRLTPPLVVTEGRLPEMLYTPKQLFATDLVQDLAWAKALMDLPRDSQKQLLPHAPAADEAMRWLALGKVVRRLHVELAADGLDFTAVLKRGPKLADFGEAKRWQALVAAQQSYLALLHVQELWDIQTARLKSVEWREIVTDRDIILLGTVDLNSTQRQMLDQVAARVTAYIVAPEQLADRFDAHGCLLTNAWCGAEIPLGDEQMLQVDGPQEQAEAISDWLRELGGRFRSDEVAIGLPDKSLVLQLQRQMDQCGVKVRWVEGVRLSQTGPFRLLAAAVQYASQRRYDDLAALVRHPDVEGWLIKALPNLGGTRTGATLAQAMSLPAQLDRFYNARLPGQMPSGRAFHNQPDWPDLAAVVEQVDEWIHEASATRPLRMWSPIFRNILGVVYGGRTLLLDNQEDEVLHRTLGKLLGACDMLDDVPEALDTASVSAADAFQVAMGPLGDEALPPPADPQAVEILGWLELPLDDSRALVVTSFNEGLVPQSASADAFLPDRLRRELGLLHNDRRYARDAYATSVLCRGREELRVVMARRNAQRDPLAPSRLVFACPDETLVRRARQFFAEPKESGGSAKLLLAPPEGILERSSFKVPEPAPPKAKLKHISVTRFKTYLACPYRYYLRHVEKLQVVDDSARELDGRAFGNLIHGVLSDFGRQTEAPRQSTREQELFEYLDERLRTLAKRHYGAKERRARSVCNLSRHASGCMHSRPGRQG